MIFLVPNQATDCCRMFRAFNYYHPRRDPTDAPCALPKGHDGGHRTQISGSPWTLYVEWHELPEMRKRRVLGG